MKSCQAGPKTSTPSPKNRERIDRNYAIKIKQCGVIFMVRFSMRTDTHTHTKRENERRALAKVRVSLRLSERDGTKVIIYNCPCCSNCSFNSAAADKIVSYCRRCGAGRTRLSQGQGYSRDRGSWDTDIWVTRETNALTACECPTPPYSSSPCLSLFLCLPGPSD